MGNSATIRVGAPGASKASSEIDQLRDRFTKLQQQGAKYNAQGGLAAGIGAAVTLKALNLVGSAIGDVTGFLGDSVHAYQNEAVAQGRLNASLKANVAGWNGNTDAIKAATEAGIKLGFTDTDTTNAIATLVTATHDQAKALHILGVAQDLARFKNISLNDAATALTSIEAGRSRGLAQLGINVKDFATTEERLAAVEKVAGGQASTFADTDLGKLDVATAKVDAAQEKFGKGLSHLEVAILPAVADAIGSLGDGLDRTSIAFDQLTASAAKSGGYAARGQLKALTEAAQAQGVSVQDLYARWQATGGSIADAAATFHTAAKAADDLYVPLTTVASATADVVDQAAALRRSGAMLSTILDDEASAADKAASAIKDYRTTVEDAFKGVNDAALDKEQTSVKIMENDAELAKVEADIAKGGTKLQVAEWKLRAHEILAENLELKLHLAEIGTNMQKEVGLNALLTSKAMHDGLLSKNPETAAAWKALKAKILGDLGLIKTEGGPAARAAAKAILAGLGSVGKIAGGVDVQFTLSTGRGPVQNLAEGGIVKAKPGGTIVRVAEAGHDEAVVPLSGPSAPRLSPFPGGFRGGASVTVNVYLPNAYGMTPGQGEALARAIEPHITRAQQRRGHLAPARAF